MKNTVSRRGFLNRLLLVGGAVSAVPAFALSRDLTAFTLMRKEVMLHELTLADFARHLGGKFTLLTESGRAVTIELIEASALGKRGPRPAHLAQRDPFSVVFLVPKDAGLTQRIYRLEHDGMGEFEIFLVPIGMTEQGLKCEAIFN